MKHNYWSSLWLCGFMFIIFLLQTMPGFTDLFILDSDLVMTRLWTLLTAVFLHADLAHLLFNLFGLALFGSILEHVIGTRRFLQLFIAAGIIASLASLPFYERVLGASGAIYGVMGCLGILRPKTQVWLYAVPMPMFVALFVWAGADILGVFSPGTTANIAHLAGLGFGVIAGFFYRRNFRENAPKKEKIDIDEKKVEDWEKMF